MTPGKIRLGYVRGNVVNHQDYDVFSEVHKKSGGKINVAVCTTDNKAPNFNLDPAKIRLHHYTDIADLQNHFDILDVSEFYRTYSQYVLNDFIGKKVVTVFDNLPFGIMSGYMGSDSRNADMVIARSPMIQRALELEGVPTEKIRVVPSAVNTNLFKPGILTNQSPIVLFVGRLVPEKGLWDLIVAMSGLDAELRVIGTGYIDPYVELARNCNTNLNFLGAASHEQLAKIMKECSILVVPSIPKINVDNPEDSWVEQFGVVILEGMATGLPVIVSDTGSTRDIIVDGQTGFLFPPRNWDILRYYIKQLLESYSMRNEFGARGRERVLQAFSTEKVGETLAEIYESL